MPFRSSSIDIAISTGALHHFSKPANYFTECIRIVRDCCITYEFSYDAPLDEAIKHRDELGKLATISKIIAVLHGILRRDFIEGRIARELRKADIEFEIEFIGTTTKLKIKPLKFRP